MSEINTTLGTFKGTKISSDATPETMCKEARKIERANRQQLNAAGIPNSGNTTSTMLCPGEVSKSGFSCYSRLERLKMVLMKKLTQIFCKGQQPNQRKEGIELCNEGPEKKHDYGGWASRRGGHAEACILANSRPLSGKTITFNINWYDGKGNLDKAPCDHCFRMMCHSQQICNNTIFVCDSEGNPVPIEGCPDPNTSEDEKIKQLKNAYRKFYDLVNNKII